MSGEISSPDYTGVTETPSIGASKEQLDRLYTRYRFAAEYCEGKDVLEVACGTGIGLGYLARRARKVVGGDIDPNNLKFAVEHYANRSNISLKAFDAHKFPLGDSEFDVVILYEAIYYLKEPVKFMQEAFRVLKNDGVLIVCSVNCGWSDFNPSPFSHKYFSTPELFAMLEEQGFTEIKFYGDSRVAVDSARDKIVGAMKRTAVSLHLIPKTMKGKECLKRIFMGKLSPLPSEIQDGMAQFTIPEPIFAKGMNGEYKVLFAVAYKR